jgi:hypothetical protein
MRVVHKFIEPYFGFGADTEVAAVVKAQVRHTAFPGVNHFLRKTVLPGESVRLSRPWRPSACGFTVVALPMASWAFALVAWKANNPPSRNAEA